jgi:hypothetical protein
MRGAAAAIPVLCTLLACDLEPVRPPAPATPSATDALAALAAKPTQGAADEISANIQSLHLVTEFPYPAIVDPRFGSGDPSAPGYSTVVGYAHGGDAAIWTGHYLAAEAFRYAVTRSPDALTNATRALDGIQGLVDVTAPEHPGEDPWEQPGLLARFLWPDSWWYADRMASEEGGHGVYHRTLGSVEHSWLGNTSRDQYSGIFFGLAIAFDFIKDDPDVQSRVARLATTMLHFLLENTWNVRMPDGRVSTTFLQRPDQRLALLQIGRHVNPTDVKIDSAWVTERTQAASVPLPIAAECQDPHGSYYKFNLDHINLYNLIRLEDPGVERTAYMSAFATLRDCTGTHQNAHFNMIERGLEGADATRDRDTEKFLKLWLERPRRDYYVDLRGKYPACGEDRSCRVIRIDERVNTDFLWQRSPFLLYPDRPGEGTIETPAIDYLLPYWMGRYYGVFTR